MQHFHSKTRYLPVWRNQQDHERHQLQTPEPNQFTYRKQLTLFGLIPVQTNRLISVICLHETASQLCCKCRGNSDADISSNRRKEKYHIFAYCLHLVCFALNPNASETVQYRHLSSRSTKKHFNAIQGVRC